MSASAGAAASQNLSSGTKSKKSSGNQKKKKPTTKGKDNNSSTGDTKNANGLPKVEDTRQREDDTDQDLDSAKVADEPPTPTTPSTKTNGVTVPIRNANDDHIMSNRSIRSPTQQAANEDSGAVEQDNGASNTETLLAKSTDTLQRMELISKDRDALLLEVETLRKSLEDAKQQHQQELFATKEELEEVQAERDQAEENYQSLLGKVNGIKAQLGERLKADRAELAQTRDRIEGLEDQNNLLQESNDALKAELAKLGDENAQQSKELSSLRNRNNLSQQNWSKERDDLTAQAAFAKEEFEAARQAMQDWEILAMEERSIRESLSERVAELLEEVANNKEAYEKAASDRDNQSLTVDGLQRALQEIQDARKRELRELVETNQTQVEEMQRQLQDFSKRAIEAESKSEASHKELERALPFEKEVKEKNLLIGKLRHQAVTLNDHLTKALRFLKKGNPDDNVDRQIVTNHFLHFLALDRTDPKKFQVLQLIAALLNWSDEQREQAGLTRPGASNSTSLRAPQSPFHRTPSTPAFATEFFPENNSNNKESLAELWSNFLEQEAQAGRKTPQPLNTSNLPKEPSQG